jgi:hypothetical protein
MINGFEDITYELTDYEKNTLLPVIVNGLNQMKGKNNCFTNKQCCTKLSKLGYDCDDPRFRKIIHHIRTKGLVTNLIATSRGYYRATSKQEIEGYITSLKERRNSISAVINALEKDAISFDQLEIQTPK